MSIIAILIGRNRPMKHAMLIRALVLGASVAAVLGTASPTAAYELRGRGLYARFGISSAAGRGFVVVDRTNTSHPHVNMVFVDLAPSIEQNIVFRSIGCADTPSKANEIFSVIGVADGNGDLTDVQSLASTINFARVRSTWSSSGSNRACSRSTGFVRVATGDVNGDDLLGLVKTGPGTLALLAERHSSSVLVSVVVTGIGGNDAVKVLATTSSCSSATPASSVVWQDTLQHAFKTGPGSFTPAQLRSIRALRTRNTTTGATRCAPAVIMANTEGDFH